MRKLAELLKGLAVTDSTLEINNVCIDSREVQAGDLFICLKGQDFDGHEFTLQAQMLGAVAIVCEHGVESTLPQYIVADTRKAYAKISKTYWHNAADSLKIVSIVGTNGKTSTATILTRILTESGIKTGQIGTLGATYDGKTVQTDMTTPDPYKLHRLLYKMKKSGVTAVVMEVTAHAIALKKLCGIVADFAVFTNVSQDHLDYFKDMETYSRVKRSYFGEKTAKIGIINADDAIGRKILNETPLKTITYGMAEPSDVFAIDVVNSLKGTEFVVNAFDDIFSVTSPLFGLHNVYNTLAAITVARLMSVPIETVIKAVSEMGEIEGRFNMVAYKGGKVLIDFAHTPDGLINLLTAARAVTDGRLWVVFGCGGNRDKTKRGVMGAIAGRLADIVIITSDNPRFEEPVDIIADIVPELGAATRNYAIIKNRKEAIAYALDKMATGDTVVIAGKGGERYTEVKGKRIAGDDLSDVKELIGEAAVE